MKEVKIRLGFKVAPWGRPFHELFMRIFHSFTELLVHQLEFQLGWLVWMVGLDGWMVGWQELLKLARS